MVEFQQFWGAVEASNPCLPISVLPVPMAVFLLQTQLQTRVGFLIALNWASTETRLPWLTSDATRVILERGLVWGGSTSDSDRNSGFWGGTFAPLMRFRECVIVALPAAVGEPFTDAQVLCIIDMADVTEERIIAAGEEAEAAILQRRENIDRISLREEQDRESLRMDQERDRERQRLIEIEEQQENEERRLREEHEASIRHLDGNSGSGDIRVRFRGRSGVFERRFTPTDTNELLHQVAQANFGHYRVRLTYFGQDIPDNQDPIDVVDATTLMVLCDE
ncbi:predicted protein [Nematostella vectensis]|uniref:UBX domain-containing protein n=1 Tax=Nematostella vectensis TaxID=45351 RepID=A7S6I6_NEMVE|nr:predicted protein [Nematostella vectensis]|eukprot:XP_001632718.1 predicted protein [Nematostella vectensis]